MGDQVAAHSGTVRGSRRGGLAGAGDNARVADGAGDAVRRIGVRLSALAQDGLAYAPCGYDLGRYRQAGRLAASSHAESPGSQAVPAAQDGLGLAAAEAGLPLPGWKQSEPEGLTQNPGGQVQAAPFQWTITGRSKSSPTAQASPAQTRPPR